jgi:U3 small nucleolar RNA-associated protein 3
MGKKRKSSRSGNGATSEPKDDMEMATTAKYDQDETFADSQDEFFTGKDEIMLEEGPSRKRRKQIEEEGKHFAGGGLGLL